MRSNSSVLNELAFTRVGPAVSYRPPPRSARPYGAPIAHSRGPLARRRVGHGGYRTEYKISRINAFVKDDGWPMTQV